MTPVRICVAVYYCGDTMVLTSVILSDSEGSPRRNVEMLRFAQHDRNHHLHCVEALHLRLGCVLLGHAAATFLRALAWRAHEVDPGLGIVE